MVRIARLWLTGQAARPHKSAAAGVLLSLGSTTVPAVGITSLVGCFND